VPLSRRPSPPGSSVAGSARPRAALLAPLVGAGAAALLWLAPTAHAQVSFTGPTNFATGGAPFSIAVGDFNGDSDPDLAVTNRLSGTVSVLLGGAGGSFDAVTNVAAGDAPVSIAVGDFNGDSDPDLAVANQFSDNVSVLLGGAGGSFGAATNFAAGDAPVSIAVGDFNGDSDPDLAVANLFSDDVSVLLGGAGGSFGAATNFAAGDAPRSVAVGDFNGDSDPDLAVANSGSDNVSVLLNTTERAMPTTKDQCKKGGAFEHSPLFKNQGDCVSLVATGGKNPPGKKQKRP
jgi:predicted NUDIX family NTP pyrophosphohydrolase